MTTPSATPSSLLEQSLAVLFRQARPLTPPERTMVNLVLPRLTLAQLNALAREAMHPEGRALLRDARQPLQARALVVDLQTIFQAWNASPSLREFWDDRGGLPALVRSVSRSWH